MNNSSPNLLDLDAVSLQAQNIQRGYQDAHKTYHHLVHEQHQLDGLLHVAIENLKNIFATKIPEISKMLNTLDEHTEQLVELQKTLLGNFWEELLLRLDTNHPETVCEYFDHSPYNPYRNWARKDIDNIMKLVFPNLRPQRTLPTVSLGNIQALDGKLVFLGDHPFHFQSLGVGAPYRLEPTGDHLFLHFSPTTTPELDAWSGDLAWGMLSVSRLLISYLSKEEYKNLSEVAILRLKLDNLQPKLDRAHAMLKNYTLQKQNIKLELVAIQQQINNIQTQLDEIFASQKDE